MLRHLVPNHPHAFRELQPRGGSARRRALAALLGPAWHFDARTQSRTSAEEQAALCFEAIGACLTEAGMAFADIVRINAYVTDRAHMAPYMAVRDRYVALPPPASTLMIVGGFTRPEFKVEVEAIAAKV